MRDTPIEKRQSNKQNCYSVFFVGTSPNPSKGGELPNGVRVKTRAGTFFSLSKEGVPKGVRVKTKAGTSPSPAKKGSI